MNSDDCAFCFIDIDVDNFRMKLGTAAAFVDATDSRYGLSSKKLLLLGGSELARLQDMIGNDHEWQSRNSTVGGIETRPPISGQRIVVKLDWKRAPLACENFATLCSNGSGRKSKIPVGDCGKPLTYRGSTVHRVIPGFVVQGGDFVKGNGSGGESVFGKKFKDERAGLGVKLDRRGLLAMGNSGKNSNTSQFFFTLEKAPQCDGKHVVFGEITSGMEVLDEVEKHGAANGTPRVSITITDCGIYKPLSTPGAGYWYDQPDIESYLGVSPTFIARPRVVCLAPSRDAFRKLKTALGTSCHVLSDVEIDKSKRVEQLAFISQLLSNYCVDVVLVAPACRDIKALISLPASWCERDLTIDEVVLVAKPVDALTSIHAGSWMSTRRTWGLDGNL